MLTRLVCHRLQYQRHSFRRQLVRIPWNNNKKPGISTIRSTYLWEFILWKNYQKTGFTASTIPNDNELLSYCRHSYKKDFIILEILVLFRKQEIGNTGKVHMHGWIKRATPNGFRAQYGIGMDRLIYRRRGDRLLDRLLDLEWSSERFLSRLLDRLRLLFLRSSWSSLSESELERFLDFLLKKLLI